MNGNVSRFPITTWERIKNQRGHAAANCIVSGRYLKFGEVGHCGKDGFAVIIDVMTDADSEYPDKKLCELIIPINELINIIHLLEDTIGDSEE